MYLGLDPISAAPRCIHQEFLQRWRLDAWRGAPVKVFVKGLWVMVVLLLFIMVHCADRRTAKSSVFDDVRYDKVQYIGALRTAHYALLYARPR